MCLCCGQFRVSDDAINELISLSPRARDETLMRAALDVNTNSMPIISVYTL